MLNNYNNNLMHNDQFRTKVESYSPKSSPRGARSPVVSRQDSSGTLKTTISLGKNPTIVHSGPFYLWKEQPGKSELTGATNLMNTYGLEHSYAKFSGKKVKEQLSSFLPSLPGVIDGPGQSVRVALLTLFSKCIFIEFFFHFAGQQFPAKCHRKTTDRWQRVAVTVQRSIGRISFASRTIARTLSLLEYDANA